MNISNISPIRFSGNYGQLRVVASNPEPVKKESLPDAVRTKFYNLPVFYEVESLNSFIKDGGKLDFNKATIGDEPYSGIIARNCGTFYAKQTYKSGRSKCIAIKAGNDEVKLKYAGTTSRYDDNSDFYVNRFWEDKKGKVKYVETFGGDGVLRGVELTEYKNDRAISKTTTTFNKSGLSAIKTRYENPKGLNADAVEFKYDKKGLVKEKSLIDVRYYDRNNELYAKSDKRTTVYKGSTPVFIEDVGYELMDDTLGFSPIRACILNLPEKVTRTKFCNNNKIEYTDTDAGRLYAVEFYDEGEKIPFKIINYQNGQTTDIQKLPNNIVRLDVYNGPNDRAHVVTFQKTNGKYRIRYIENYKDDIKTSVDIHLKSGLWEHKEKIPTAIYPENQE